MCKIFSAMFYEFVRAWYHSLELDPIFDFTDMCAKFVAHFSISILVKKSSTKLFVIIQWENESTRAYLKMFNDKIIKVEGLVEPVTI